MEIGKIPNELLQNIILNKIKSNRKEVILKPKIGEDCCGVDFGSEICVMSTDPITGTANEIGRLAVHISCNDIASCGVEPIGILATILVPPNATESELEAVMSGLCNTASELNVEVMGGHTEVTDAVNRFVITATSMGKINKERLVSTSGAKAGDDILVTKSVGLEGTGIIAHEKEYELVCTFGKAFVEKSKEYLSQISVIKEGSIAGRFGVNSMHDITEGGILGAAWEISEASEKGIEIYENAIPIEDETRKICKYYGINPLKLISSGSMLITCENGPGLAAELSKHNIKASCIGKVLGSNEKKLISENDVKDIDQPQSDELYKVLRRS